MFLSPILIPACNSSSLAFLMMCSVYRLNNQAHSRHPCCTPFLILSQSFFSIQGSNCCFLPHIQVSQETVKVVRYSHLFKNFPQFFVFCTVKSIHVFNEAEVDTFLKFLCFLYDPTNVGNFHLWLPLPWLNPPCTSGISQFKYC